MEMPVQFVYADDALEYMFDKLTQPKELTKLQLLLQSGISIEAVTNTLLFTGVATGKWTVDLALLMYQVVFWQIEAIAKLKKIKYTHKNVDIEHEKFLSNFTNLLNTPEEAPEPEKKSAIFKGLL
jgi:hypothetical protein